MLDTNFERIGEKHQKEQTKKSKKIKRIYKYENLLADGDNPFYQNLQYTNILKDLY